MLRSAFFCQPQTIIQTKKKIKNKNIRSEKLTIHLLIPPPLHQLHQFRILQSCMVYDYTIFKNLKGAVLFYEQVPFFLRMQRMSQRRHVNHSFKPRVYFPFDFLLLISPTQNASWHKCISAIKFISTRTHYYKLSIMQSGPLTSHNRCESDFLYSGYIAELC